MTKFNKSMNDLTIQKVHFNYFLLFFLVFYTVHLLLCIKVPEKVEKKFAKGKLRNQLPDSQTSRKPSTYKSSHSAGKTFPKKLVEVERGDTEKMQPQQRFPARISRSSLDSKNQKAVVNILTDSKWRAIRKIQNT